MSYPIIDESLVGYTPSYPTRTPKYPWLETPVGKSFFVPYKDDEEFRPVVRRLRNSLNWYKRGQRVKGGVQFRFKEHRQGKKLGVLAGRVK